MVCQTCGSVCRGTCAKCGAALCARHKPKNARAKCVFCPRTTRATSKPASALPVGRAPAQHSFFPVASLSLVGLPSSEQLTWIAERRVRLQQKQDRERAYLDRRAARGTHTPTDDAYEADARLENDLFEALD